MGSLNSFGNDDEDEFKLDSDFSLDDDAPSLSFDSEDDEPLHGELIDRSSNRTDRNISNLGQSVGNQLSQWFNGAKDAFSQPAAPTRGGRVAKKVSQVANPTAEMAGSMVGAATEATGAFVGAAAQHLYYYRDGEGVGNYVKRAGRNVGMTIAGMYIASLAFVQGCLPGKHKEEPKKVEPVPAATAPANPGSSNDTYKIEIPKFWK